MGCGGETIIELVTLVAEEIDAMAGEMSGRLEVIDAELGDVRKRLEKLYEAIETPVDSLSAAMLGGAQGRRCVRVGLDATRESANLVEDGFRSTPEVQRGDLDRLARVLDLVRTWLVLAGGVD